MRSCDGKEVALGAEQVVGRSAWCRLRLESAAVSGTHARIYWAGTSWMVQDLASRNGTLCNDTIVDLGTQRRIKRGATLVFGDRQETWTLVDQARPQRQLVPLDSGPPHVLGTFPVALPNDKAPVATVYRKDGRWYVETCGAREELSNGSVFVVAGRHLLFEDPELAFVTPQLADPPVSFENISLRFNVSRDEEFVELTIESSHGVKHLARRSCFYLAMLLATARLRDNESNSETNNAEAGWVDVALLLRDISEYQTAIHLNVDVFRLRHSLSSANILDASTVIERRRGQIRIGTGKLVVVRDAHGASTDIK